MAGTKNKHSVDRFPEVIRALRTEKGMTQEELADLAGLHFTYISQIERGLKSPSLRSLGQIADALDIPLSTLVKRMEN
ncbi:MAG TPA: helix-turn-helix transcriptional regulator [Acidiferrobacterales bacterium]|nr:helix-turn-helix transcriptional regulator [Acidiferrobacterales bacterium]